MHHLPGADQHDVARRQVDLGHVARRIEIGRGDGVAGLQHVEAAGPGHIEQHAPADHRLQQMDAAEGGAPFTNRIGGVPVVDVAAVADMGQPVPVGGALQRQRDHVLAGAHPRGIRAQRLVDLDHRAGRVHPSLDEPRLDPLGLREGETEGE